jgi:hypothetical protein
MGAKAYGLVSLLSLLLKTMEKLVDIYIRDTVRSNPLHWNQFPFQVGKYIETVLHSVESCTENAVQHNEIALGNLAIEEILQDLIQSNSKDNWTAWSAAQSSQKHNNIIRNYPEEDHI